MFDGGEALIRFETLIAGIETLGTVIVIVSGKRRAGPELASGRSAERSDLARSAAHDHAMAVVILAGGTIILSAGLIGKWSRGDHVRADDARLIETVDERTSVIVIFIIVHF
jgi:hypothetical protein